MHTKRRGELTGRERDRNAAFYSLQRWANTCCLCVHRELRPFFQPKRHLVYVLAGVSERKNEKKDSGKHTNGRGPSFCGPKQSQIPEGSHPLACVRCLYDLIIGERGPTLKDGRLRPLPPSSPIRWARRGLARRDACVDGCRWPVMRGRRGWIQSLALMAAAPFIYGMIDGGFPNERWPGIMSLRAVRRGRGKKINSRRNSSRWTGVYTATIRRRRL